ncbi:protease complex subunit PrcB family protein [Orenia marismortui]|uniref:Protease stability complex PrcB-like protein n=1 Tax=Orenia marismortui TaxID=46469 RepID=A0A4R8H223_9FIRM|nr:protease complex subunit PrcB family protein [Orenia marismortui]TDX52363.1 protease stability complex PrcB-like protein [Orenia marismortui]
MKSKITLMLLLFLLLTGCNQNLLQEGELLYKNTEDLKGEWQESNYPEDSRFVLIDDKNLDQFQEELRGVKGLRLDDQLAIYITLGERPSGGYGIQIKQVRKKDNKLLVVVKAVGPEPTDVVTQIITYPYDIVKLPLEELGKIKKVIFISEKGNKLREKNL